ncbi:hypothetical protein ACFYXH_32150 [Streptomyces sp. NPDC002730]|uniref:CYTH domain-containing protein n=1 Tax=Streptomyces sp. NPDC002730 TaxID=3364662 RepID=UPI00369DDEA8
MKDGAPFMTVKTSGASDYRMVRVEVEFAIAEDVFHRLWEVAGDRLSKARWSVPVGQHTATVDVFDGDLAGLRLVEVEFGSVEEARGFHPPSWFGEELTGDAAWSNRALAARPHPGAGKRTD